MVVEDRYDPPAPWIRLGEVYHDTREDFLEGWLMDRAARLGVLADMAQSGGRWTVKAEALALELSEELSKALREDGRSRVWQLHEYEEAHGYQDPSGDVMNLLYKATDRIASEAKSKGLCLDESDVWTSTLERVRQHLKDHT